MTKPIDAQAVTEKIWRKLSDRLRQFIRSRGISAADVDDILQNVFLRIQQNLKTVRQVDWIDSWVFQVTRNAISDHFRKPRATAGDVESAAPPTAPTDAANANQAIAECVVAMIDQLPAEQQRAVTLYEIDGVPQAEIAEREAISVTAAKSRIQRGRKKLLALLLKCCQYEFDRRGNILEYHSNAGECGEDCQE